MRHVEKHERNKIGWGKGKFGIVVSRENAIKYIALLPENENQHRTDYLERRQKKP